MKKHGVIMVFLLILALCSIGIVSANENVTASGDGPQKSLNQENIPIENTENGESSNINIPSNYANHSQNEINYEKESRNVNVASNNEINYENNKSSKINVALSSCDNLDNEINYKINANELSDFSSISELPSLEINDNKLTTDSGKSIDPPESTKISDKTSKNVLNKINNSPNGYVKRSNGNLLMLPLTKTNLNINTKESLIIRFNEDETEKLLLFGNAGLTDNSRNNYQSNGVISGVTSSSGNNSSITKKERPLSTGFSNQENNYPQNDLPLDNAKNVLGVSRDSDDDAFIWNKNSDKRASVIVDMVNKATNGVLKLNLNEKQDDLKLTSNEIKEIGVNASLIALDYFKSEGINIQKGYPYLYVLTSAGEVKINETSTGDAISGISEVLGLELNKNIFPIHDPLWKELIFYYIWVNSANNKDMCSYALKYDDKTSKLIVSEEYKKQGDQIAYKMGLYEKYSPAPKPHYRGGGCVVINKVNAVNLANNITDVNNTEDVNNTTTTENKINIPENSILYSGNPFNVLYTLIAILIVSTIFGIGYSKRDR